MNTVFVIATPGPLEVDTVIDGPSARYWAVQHVAMLQTEFDIKASVFAFHGARASFAADAACDMIQDGRPFGRRALAKLADEFAVRTGMGFTCLAATTDATPFPGISA